MTLTLGIDLGTVNPAACILDLARQKPRRVVSYHGHFPKEGRAKLRARSDQAIRLMCTWIDWAVAGGVTRVAVEDPRAVAHGKSSRGQTNYAASMELITQYVTVCAHARAQGMLVASLTPREIARVLGVKVSVRRDGLTPGQLEYARRKQKKAQTRKWAELCIDGSSELATEDEIDAASIAYVGGKRLR